MNTTYFGNRHTTAVAVILIALFGITAFGLTACNSTGSTSPIAAFDDASGATALNSLGALAKGTASTQALEQNDIIQSLQEEQLYEVLGLNKRGGNGGGGNDNGGVAGIPDTNGTRAEAMLEISRRLSSAGATSGASASSRFNSALGVQGVSVSVLGASYQFVTPTQRTPNVNQPQRPNSTHANARPNSTNANARPARIAETLFTFPARPTSSTATAPALIALMDANATATFTVSGYTLSDNTIEIPSKITFASLSEGATIARSAAQTLRWNVTGGFTGGVITIRNVADSTVLAGKTRQEIRQILSSLPKPITKQLTTGASSVEFTAAELATLQAGTARLSISVANVKRTNTDKAVLKADSHTSLGIRLQ